MTDRSVWGVHDYVTSYSITSYAEAVLSRVAQPDLASAPVGKSSGPSGCGWYRIILPLSELANHGWRTGWRQGTPPADSDHRIMVAQRLDKPKVLPLWRSQRLKHKLVYETDDDIFSVPAERWQNATYPQAVMEDTVTEAARISHMVTVSTEPLAEVYRKRGCDNVKVLPNCIPGGVLEIDRLRHHRNLVVGWAGGGSHALDLQLAAGQVNEFVRGRKNTEMHIIGSNFTDLFPAARFTEWVPADASLEFYRRFDFDIGIAPLRGTVFDQSKSSIKALEYMALGIPVLASDVTPYRDLVVDGVNGYLIRKPGEWGRRLRELANDTAAREEMGVKARETARAHTIEANWQQWAAAYEELL